MGAVDEVCDLDLDSAAEAIDRAMGALRRGVVTPMEAVTSIRGTASLFLRFAAVPAEDVDFLIQYARQAVEEVALSRDVMDPVLVEAFDEWLRGEHMVGGLQVQLDELIEGLVADAQDGSAIGRSGIADLCRTGRHSHRTLLHLNTAATQILRAAFEIGCAEGLRDAISPRFRDRGQVARPDKDGAEFVLVLNLLARLAVDPDSGAGARSALLDLADYVELTGAAVVRLPMHLLDDDDRARLLEIHERRVALLCDDPLVVPLGLSILRDNRVVRGALWQAFDARHIC